jgi:hypothetical protein
MKIFRGFIRGMRNIYWKKHQLNQMKIKVTLTQNPLTHSLGFASTKPGQTPTPLGNHGGDSFM